MGGCRDGYACDHIPSHLPGLRCVRGQIACDAASAVSVANIRIHLYCGHLEVGKQEEADSVVVDEAGFVVEAMPRHIIRFAVQRGFIHNICSCGSGW